MSKTLKGNRRKDFIKGQLNEISEDKTILFLEKDTKDTVVIDIHLKNSEYAVYSEEYLPIELDVTGHKKADITVLLLDEERKHIKYYIADVKSNLTGPERICSLCEQWNAGLRYVRNHILSNFSEEFIEEEHIAVYTRSFDKPRIQRMIEDLNEEIEIMAKNVNKGNMAAIKLRPLKEMKLKQQMVILKDFLEKQFTYSDKFIKEEKHKFEVGELLYEDITQHYQYTLIVSF